MQKIANRVSLGAVHTHTHTHICTFRKIKRVANEAALFGVEDRLFVALYEGKNKVLEIACFLRCRKFIPVGEIFVQRDYANCKEFLCNYYCLEILAICFLRVKFLEYLIKKLFCTNTEFVEDSVKQGGVE